MPLACLFPVSSFKSVAKSVGLDFNELEPAAGVAVARPAVWLLARRIFGATYAGIELSTCAFRVRRIVASS